MLFSLKFKEPPSHNIPQPLLYSYSQLQSNIVVDYQVDSEQEGPGGVDASYRLKFNTEILQRFVDEGKIRLDNNSTYYFNLIKLW